MVCHLWHLYVKFYKRYYYFFNNIIGRIIYGSYYSQEG